MHEFDYKAVNEVIYQENGVTITLDPGDPRGRRLGELHPDVERPEVRLLERHLSQQVVDGAHQGLRPRHPRVLRAAVDHGEQAEVRGGDALNVATQVHTSPAMFGKVMSEIKPRMAVGYHVFNDFDTQPQIMKEIRQTYDGPVELAVDYMVFNVTKDEIRSAWRRRRGHLAAAVGHQEAAADPKDRVGFSDYITGGRVVFKDVIEFYYDQTNKMFGTDFKAPD